MSDNLQPMAITAYLVRFGEWLKLRPERETGDYAASDALRPTLERLWFQALRIGHTPQEIDAAIYERFGVRVPREV